MKSRSSISRLAARRLALRPITGQRRAVSCGGTVGVRIIGHLRGATPNAFMPGLCADQFGSFESIITKHYRDPWSRDLPVATRVVGAMEGAGA